MSSFPSCLGVAALLLAGSACGGAPPPGAPIPESRQGTFRFLERVEGSSPEILLEGELTVGPDTVLVDVNRGLCQPPLQPDTQNFRYRCGELTLSFDRRNPTQRASYTVRGRGFEVRRVCRRTAPGSDGRPVCVQFGQELVEAERTFTGRLRPIPAT
jgi:hypothetical protein